jgi:hypothetical protein
LKYLGQLHQEIDELKKINLQHKAREHQYAVARLTTKDAATGGKFTTDDQDAKESLMDSRIMTLTEDNDILRKELTENNYWLDNQAGLIESLERVGKEKENLLA